MPASIANLGPGFDLLAMAVDLWLEVEAEESDRPEWRFQGEGAELLQATPNPISRLKLRGSVRSEIPLGVGLGSSAAARLAVLGLRGGDPEQILRAAIGEEGHPDNVAAAQGGGVVLVVGGEVHRLPAPDLEVALLVATQPFPTEAARKVIPDLLPREDSIFNSGRVGLFVTALHSRRWDLLQTAMDDRLHQPYRFPLFPWAAGAIEAARAAGAHGAALAGAGPSVFALCGPGSGARVAAAMAAAAPGCGRPLLTRVSSQGMSVQ